MLAIYCYHIVSYQLVAVALILETSAIIHRESKNGATYTFVYNSDKCWPVFKILSLLYSPKNLQQNLCYMAHNHLSCVTLAVLRKIRNRNLRNSAAFNTILSKHLLNVHKINKQDTRNNICVSMS